MSRLVPLFLILAIAPTAMAEKPPIDPELAETIRETEGMPEMFARCMGYWQWFGQYLEANGQPASGEYVRTYANGAQTAALWLLAAQYQVENPDKPPRRLGEFGHHLEGPADLERLRMAALAETGDSEAIEQANAHCLEVAQASHPLLQSLRKEMLLEAGE